MAESERRSEEHTDTRGTGRQGQITSRRWPHAHLPRAAYIPGRPAGRARARAAGTPARACTGDSPFLTFALRPLARKAEAPPYRKHSEGHNTICFVVPAMAVVTLTS